MPLLLFPDKGFKFRLQVRNSCNDVLMMSTNLNEIAVLNIYRVDYHCIINGISKSDAVNLHQNANLPLGRGLL